MDPRPSASSSEPLSSSTPDSWPQAQDSVPRADSEMEVQPHITEDTSSVWDLTYLLDFNLDEQIVIPLDADQNWEFPEQLELPPPENPSTDKVRKRDPRLTCSNFLAGRVPCACPELDQKLEDEGLPRKKRARTVRASDVVVRCQVPGCEADISELKGYHRRHRVCLRCANATTVVLDGEARRYCQQCGKFHVLADFDEGKRSCRRKLQHHNILRRRKTKDCRGTTENDLQPVMQPEDVEYDGEAGKDSSYLRSEITEKGASLEHDSAPDTQNVNSDGIVSYAASGETQVNGRIDNPIFSRSSSYHDKSPYVSMCPTGRISFKLYDWNPAEFPRRLRHQIFEWLASMPVELEGYIRPGCTILTAFIAMPKLMWMNLNEDPLCYVHDIVAPGKMLSGRGAMLVHLNEMIFHVFEDGVSTMKIELKVQTPRLHYVHPTYFEAGKPMEFVACGSNLMQPKFRLLVSFSGKYLKYESCVVSPHSWTEDSISCAFKDQLYKIYIPHTEPNLFGPAFIEVENESGLSNFIPVLIGDKEVCSEMKTLQQRLDATLISKQFQSASVGDICGSCEAYMLRHAAYSDFLVDIGWLLKDPTSEMFHGALTASQIQRLHYLLNFLICDDSTTILGKILQNLMILTETKELKNVNYQISDADMMLLQECMYYAGDALYQKNQKGREFVMHSVHSEMNRYGFAQSYCQDNIPSAAPMDSQGSKVGENAKLGVLRSSSSNVRSERIPLLTKDIIMNVDPIQEMPRKSGRRYLTRGFLSSRPAILVIASVAVCIGICAALLHTDRVGGFAVSIRRCLFKTN